MKLKLIILLFAMLAGNTDMPNNWAVDADKAKIKFTLSGPFGQVDGTLSGLKATVIFDENNLASSSIAASVPVGTINTGIGLRDRDLCNEEVWFDTKKYPLILFRSTGIRRSGNGFVAAGSLTMKGVTRAINIPFTFTPNGKSGVLKGKFTINREEYGVGDTRNVGKDIEITLEVPVNR